MDTLKIKDLSAEEQFRLLERARFEGGKTSCPYCLSLRVSGGVDKDYHCNACNRNFTLFTNTKLHNCKLSPVNVLKLVKYFADSSSGISIKELARILEINKGSVQRLVALIRECLPEDSTLLSGIVQADETYIGGKNNNRHKNKQKRKSKGRSTAGQQLILALYCNDSKQVRAALAENANMKQINAFILLNVELHSTIHTDEWSGYKGLGNLAYLHETVYHGNREFVKGGITTNGVENFWSFLKRAYKGVHIHIPRERFALFLKEMVFRYNTPNHRERAMLILKALLNLKSKENR